jgi:DNA-binding HxlR family transcriptional regulator
LVTFRVTFEGSNRVERVRAEAYRSVPPHVEFVVTEGKGLNVGNQVVAKFDGRQIARITTTG